MKIDPRQVEAFLKKPDPKIRGVVVYGNDDVVWFEQPPAEGEGCGPSRRVSARSTRCLTAAICEGCMEKQRSPIASKSSVNAGSPAISPQTLTLLPAAREQAIVCAMS